MLRHAVVLLLLGSCKQLLGIDEAHVAPPAVDAPPADADHSERRKVLAIAANIPTENIDGFPVWVALEDADIAARARADGSDLRFATLAGETLAHELVRWNPTTGQLQAWVHVAVMSTGTQFAIHYGPSSTAPIDDGARVFSNGYVAVWHLDDDLVGTTIADARGMTPGVSTGLTPAAAVPGVMQGGIRFETVAQRIQFTNPLLGNTSHTMSAWVKLGAERAYDPLIVVGSPVINKSRWMHARFPPTEKLGIGLYGNDVASTVVPVVDQWTMVHWVFDGTTRTTRLYVDGAEIAQHEHGNSAQTEGAAGYLGYAPAPWGPAVEIGLNGVLDEVRISNVTRTPGFIALEHRNQRDPAAFLVVGPEELP